MINFFRNLIRTLSSIVGGNTAKSEKGKVKDAASLQYEQDVKNLNTEIDNIQVKSEAFSNLVDQKIEETNSKYNDEIKKIEDEEKALDDLMKSMELS